MYYLLGDDSSHTILCRLAAPYLDGDITRASRPSWKNAYNRYLSSLQPHIPRRSGWGPELVDDHALEERLIRGFYSESQLDDLPRYRDATFFEHGDHLRAEIHKDIAYLRGALDEFTAHDPAFWAFFGLLVNFILCPRSRYSRGGADSDAIGVIYMCEPRGLSPQDLYELLVHESTHNIYFLDERIYGHYRSYRALPDPDNWCRAVMSGLRRPLDKVLHSLLVTTEVLLHREHTLGHAGDTRVHGPTRELAASARESIAALRAMPNYHALMTDRAIHLIDRCADVMTAF